MASNKYDEISEMIVDAARVKMTLNSHKGDIEGHPPDKAMTLAIKEMEEMMAAYSKNDYEKVIMEAGDTLNFLISIVYNAVQAYRNRRKEDDGLRSNAKNV